jgi:hypothetical protein
MYTSLTITSLRVGNVSLTLCSITTGTLVETDYKCSSHMMICVLNTFLTGRISHGIFAEVLKENISIRSGTKSYHTLWEKKVPANHDGMKMNCTH